MNVNVGNLAGVGPVKDHDAGSARVNVPPPLVVVVVIPTAEL